MALKPVHTDEFDALLREAFEAERAGVFGRTPLDAGRLMANPSGSPMRGYRFILAGLPIAASLALFLGMAMFWKAGGKTGGAFPNSNASLSGQNGGAAERCETLENLRACFSGPGLFAKTDCSCVDFDADGDVDLHDYGMFRIGEPVP